MDIIKGLRRTIIVVCLLILAVSGCFSFLESKYYSKDIKELVKAKRAQVGEGMKIDNGLSKRFR